MSWTGIPMLQVGLVGMSQEADFKKCRIKKK